MVEANVRTFSGNWTGTGVIAGLSDAETICLDPGEYMDSEVINTGAAVMELLQNNYGAGENVTLKYRTAATWGGTLLEDWVAYVDPFLSAGFVQVRIEVAV